MEVESPKAAPLLRGVGKSVGVVVCSVVEEVVGTSEEDDEEVADRELDGATDSGSSVVVGEVGSVGGVVGSVGGSTEGGGELS